MVERERALLNVYGSAAMGRLRLAGALAALAGALLLNLALGQVADRAGRLAPTAPDQLLPLLPRADLTWLYVWGFAVFVAWAFAVALWRERDRLSYIAWSYALLIAVRSVFIILTPLNQPAGAINPEGDPLFDAVGRYLTFRHDLFFSSHTAMPFLGCLIYRGRWVKATFLALSIALAASVLVCRLHYSIDVASAYFITYAVYRLDLVWLQRRFKTARTKSRAGAGGS